MNYTQYIDCQGLESKDPECEVTTSSEEKKEFDYNEEAKKVDPGLEIDLAHNMKTDELIMAGYDPSFIQDKVYRPENVPVKSFCFTGNGLYFAGSMCWCEFLKEWGVCNLSYPGWAPESFIGEGVRTALEGVNKFIKENPELASKEHLCFYGTISEENKFSF